MDFQATEEDPLQAALATAFTDSPILSPSPSTLASISQSPDYEPAQEQVEEGRADDSWKDEYDQHLSHWRAESAAARETAEQERERWRLIREQEEKQQADREQERETQAGVQRKDSEWETVSRSSNIGEPESASKHAVEAGRGISAAKEAAVAVQDTPRHSSANPADTRELVTGETPRRHVDTIQNPATVPAPPSNMDDHGLSSSRTWEEVPSDDSSFPSLSFPERSAAPSPDPRERPLYRQPPAPPSVTLAVFDSSLSRRARTLALISSIGINMFLPFINGVMLGFGEIFAKNVVSFFGWNTSTAVGLRAAPGRR
ncbi:hypothetical protein JB92DRAFT_2845414 [Gautieria morchelliformis]|nr:hypothetical protein JB92DRAFT_2845414 [Gautieria morchelliformis]